jgi:hypothetical protein
MNTLAGVLSLKDSSYALVTLFNLPCKKTNFHVIPKPKQNSALGIFYLNLIISCSYFFSVVIVLMLFVNSSLLINLCQQVSYYSTPKKSDLQIYDERKYF